MRIVLICGQKRAGKDTFADGAITELERLGRPATRVGHADLLKDMCRPLEPFFGPAKEDVRLLWQGVGNLVRRLRPGLWAAAAAKKAAEWGDGYVFVPDLRFPDELEMWRRLFGQDNVTLVRVERPGLPDNDQDESEHAWRALKPDLVVYNNGRLLDLVFRAQRFAHDLY